MSFTRWLESRRGQAPDIVGPIYGYRIWTGREGFLWSFYVVGCKWPVGDLLEAICMNERGHAPISKCPHIEGKPTPHIGSKCGIWMLNDPGKLPIKAGIAGVCEIGGRVVKGTEGWRAQFARPVALKHEDWNEQEVAELAKTYGCQLIEDWPDWRPS